MKFQRVLSIMLSLTLSFSGAIWAAPSVQAFAAEDQTMAEETYVTAESTPADEVEEQESAQPAEETTADPADTNDAVEAADPADEGGAVETPAADDVDNATENAEESDETTVVETTDSADNDGILSAAESSVENTATETEEDADESAVSEDISVDEGAAAQSAETGATEEIASPEADTGAEAVEELTEEESGKQAAAYNPWEVTVTCSTEKYAIGIGQSVQISYTVSPSDATDNEVVFSIGSSDIATIDSNNIVTGKNVGTTYATVFIDGCQTGPEITIEVLPTDLSGAAVSGIATKTYNGKEITQNPVVSMNGKVLSAGTDYLVSYENNTNAGTASIIIEGTGNYSGTIRRNFTIAKAKSSVSKVTSRFTFPVSIANMNKKGYYYITGDVTGEKYPVVKALSISKKAKKYIKVSKNGTITLKKGIKCGKYKIKVRITVPASENYKKSVVTKTITVTVKNNLRKYSSLKKLGVKGYDSSLDKSLNAAFDDMILSLSNDGIKYSKMSAYNKAHAITLFIGSRYKYKTGSYDAKSMLKKGYGTCFAYSDLTYLMAKKAGLKNSWLTVPGRNVNHGSSIYGSQHRSVVTKIGKKYYELDSNKTANYIDAMRSGIAYFDTSPERITKSYARYLIGKSKKYTSINPKK